MRLMPRPYARTLMILLRSRYSVVALSQRTGLDIRVLYRLYHGAPTAWTLAIQSQLEALVAPEHAHLLAAARGEAPPRD